MRIIAGRFKGRRLPAPALATRPTSDRAREMLFNMLTHGGLKDASSGQFNNINVLDTFAGTGALAFEALSRGASVVTLIEENPQALQGIRAFIQDLCLDPAPQVFPISVLHLPPAPRPFNLVFIDPPYKKNLIIPALKALDARAWIAPGALIVAEIAQKETLEPPEGFILKTVKSCGAAQFLFLEKHDNSLRS